MAEIDYVWFDLVGQVIDDAGHGRNERGFRIILPHPAEIDFLDVSATDIHNMLKAIERESN